MSGIWLRTVGRVVIALSVAMGGNLWADELATIVERATAALKSDWASDPLYACIERDEVQKGEKLTSKTFEVVMVDGSDYRLPIAINDQPLSPERENVELLKLKNEFERRRNESESARQNRIAAWKKERNENGELLLDFPDVLAFRLSGQEQKDGHSAYILSATPIPGVESTTRAKKVLSGVQGKVWVEKDGMHPMRVECTVVRPVPIYGALASVLPGTEIEISMAPVATAIWLIDEVSIRLNVSKLHVFKSTGMTRYTYTRYRLNSDVLDELLAKAAREQVRAGNLQH